MKKRWFTIVTLLTMAAILCGCGREPETAKVVPITPEQESSVLTQGESIACVHVSEQEILPDYKSTHSSEPLTPIGNWSGGGLVNGYYFAVNGEFRICNGKNACRVKTDTGDILYYHYEDGVFTPRKALAYRGNVEFPSGAMAVEFNYWLEDGALVIDDLGGGGEEPTASADRLGSETDLVLLRCGWGTNHLELAILNLETGKAEPIDTGTEPCTDAYFDSTNTRMLLQYTSGEYGLMQSGEVQNLRTLTGIQGRFFAYWESDLGPNLGPDGILITVQDNENGTLPVYAYDCKSGTTRELLSDAKGYDGTDSNVPVYETLSHAKYLCYSPDKTASVIDLAAGTERKIDGHEWQSGTGGIYSCLGGGFYFLRDGASLIQMGFLDCNSGKFTIFDRTPAAADLQEWFSPVCFDTGTFVFGVGDTFKPQYLLVYDFNSD